MKVLKFSSHNSLKVAIVVLLLGLISNTVAQTADRVLAVVNGREIRQHEVDDLLLAQIMPLEEQLYAVRKASLENLVVNVLLEAEAAKRGTSLEELRRLLTAGKVEVKPAEVERAYAENVSAFGAMSPDEAKERLRLDLETQARLAQYRRTVEEIRKSAAVEIFLQEPRWPWLALAEDSPALGSNNSTVTIIEFADFQCPYCRQSQAVLKRLMAYYGRDVKLIFKHLPLDNHSQAATAARGAFCAQKENRFWEYHDSLFALPKLEIDDLRQVARELQLDLTKFDVCLNSDVSKEAVAKDKRAAARLGITSTPTFVVNGKLIMGAIDFDAFKALIEREKASARFLSSHEPRRVAP